LRYLKYISAVISQFIYIVLLFFTVIVSIYFHQKSNQRSCVPYLPRTYWGWGGSISKKKNLLF